MPGASDLRDFVFCLIQVMEEISRTKGDPEVVFFKVWPYLEIGGLDKNAGRSVMEEEHLGTAGPRVSPRNSYSARFQQKKSGPRQQPEEVTKPLVSKSLECPALLGPPS